MRLYVTLDVVDIAGDDSLPVEVRSKRPKRVRDSLLPNNASSNKLFQTNNTPSVSNNNSNSSCYMETNGAVGYNLPVHDQSITNFTGLHANGLIPTIHTSTSSGSVQKDGERNNKKYRSESNAGNYQSYVVESNL